MAVGKLVVVTATLTIFFSGCFVSFLTSLVIGRVVLANCPLFLVKARRFCKLVGVERSLTSETGVWDLFLTTAADFWLLVTLLLIPANAFLVGLFVNRGLGVY